MGNQPLIEIRPGNGLNTGVFPTAGATSGPTWRRSDNVWFRPLSISQVLGRNKVVSAVGRSARAMAQAFANDETRLYYEDLGIVNKWAGSGNGVPIGELDEEGEYDLEPFGTWLLATDNINNVKLWKNDLLGFINIGASEFARGKIIKKLAQRVLVYSTNILPAGMHYSKPSDPETWTPVTAGIQSGAGNLPFRNLDSNPIAVVDLAGGHAVYTEDKMLTVEYLGEVLKFGTPRQPLSGIGATSKESVISRGNQNFGIFPGGVFVTDGTAYKMLDDPAMSEWISDMIDWNRGHEVSGYYDRRLKCLVWSVPLFGGSNQGISLDEGGKFSFIDANFNSSLDQEIFDAPLVALNSGIFKASIPGTILGTLQAGTHLFDGGTKDKYKAWDFVLFEGTLSGQVRFGFTDETNIESVTWQAWEPLAHRVPLVPTESVFLAIEFTSTQEFKLCGIQVYGALAGLVI